MAVGFVIIVAIIVLVILIIAHDVIRWRTLREFSGGYWSRENDGLLYIAPGTSAQAPGYMLTSDGINKPISIHFGRVIGSALEVSLDGKKVATFNLARATMTLDGREWTKSAQLNAAII